MADYRYLHRFFRNADDNLELYNVNNPPRLIQSMGADGVQRSPYADDTAGGTIPGSAPQIVNTAETGVSSPPEVIDECKLLSYALPHTTYDTNLASDAGAPLVASAEDEDIIAMDIEEPSEPVIDETCKFSKS